MIPTSDIEIILENEDWVVAAKPAPLLIHPTRPDNEFTFWHALREHLPGEELFLVNRLDRETSGLVLVSRNKEASSLLGKMVMHRQIHKRYLALVEGEVEATGTIDVPIGRKSDFEASDIYVLQIVHPEGKNAQTNYRCIGTRYHNHQAISLVELELLTGRMHQIRVHMQHIGHPVIGDKLYGPNSDYYLQVVAHGWREEMKNQLLLRRQALHAADMEFTWLEKKTRVHSPLPADLQEFWDSCTSS